MTMSKIDLTAGGRLPVSHHVTESKILAMKDLVEGVKRGNRLRAGTFVEAMTTSDAVFSFTHLTNLNLLPQFDEAPRTWTQIAGTRTVSDFRPAVLYSLVPQWESGALGDGDPRFISPIVPEAAPYPYAKFSGEEYTGNKITKRGFKVGLSWEALINDPVGYVNSLPGELLKVALDTEEYEVHNALLGTSDTYQLAAGTAPITGGTVLANDVLSRDALLLALKQWSARTVNDRKIVNTGGWNLVVAPGTSAAVNFILNQTLGQIRTNPAAGTEEFVYAVGGPNPLSGITVIESEYVSGDAWYMLPKVGGYRRPVLELGRLAGHESPELRMDNATGQYIGRSTVSPFEGSFENDTMDFRLRQVVQGLNWSQEAIIWSDGTQS